MIYGHLHTGNYVGQKSDLKSQRCTNTMRQLKAIGGDGKGILNGWPERLFLNLFPGTHIMKTQRNRKINMIICP